jgi:hypothetical protein
LKIQKIWVGILIFLENLIKEKACNLKRYEFEFEEIWVENF